MREIKFRGKRIDTGEWFYGSLLDYGDTLVIVDRDGLYHIVDPETVGSYVGVKDHKGNEIYEGDCISFSVDPKHKSDPGYVWGVVDWCPYSLTWQIEWNDKIDGTFASVSIADTIENERKIGRAHV